METEDKAPASDVERLLEVMETWAKPVPPGSSLLDVRGGQEWWDRHVDAVTLMVSVADQVERFPDKRLQASWREIEPRLQHCIFATGYPMRAVNPSWDAFEKDTLVILSAIASALTYGGGRIIETKEFLELRDELNALKSDIGNTDLGDKVREYVLHLLARVEEALAEVAITGTADVQALADQLIGSCSRLFILKDDGEESKNFRNRLKRLAGRVNSFVNSPLVVGIAGGIASGFAGQITAG